MRSSLLRQQALWRRSLLLQRPPAVSRPCCLTEARTRRLFKIHSTRNLSSFHLDNSGSTKQNWQILQDETDILLYSDDVTDEQVVRLLKQWQSHPDKGLTSKMSQHLLDHWLAFHDKKSLDLSTSEPFLLAMQASPSDVPNVLEEWQNRLGGHLELAPTLQAFHLLLKSPSVDGTKVVEYLERTQSGGNLVLEPPNVETYALAVKAMIRKGARWSQVRSMMEKLNDVNQEQSEANPRNVYFKICGYSRAICHAISLGRTREAVALMEQWKPTLSLLPTALSLYESESFLDESPVSLVQVAHQAVFSKLAANPGTDASSRQDTARFMDSFLSTLEGADMAELPSPKLYELTIIAWSKTVLEKFSREPGAHCEAWLQRMEKRHLSNPHSKISLVAYERTCWIFYSCRHASVRLLTHMMKLLQDHADVVVKSDAHVTAAWNHVLKAYFDQGRADRIAKLWRRVKKMPDIPDATTYDTVLKGLSRSIKQSSEAFRAQEILDNLVKNYQSGKSSIPPKSTHYTSVAVAWSRSSQQDAAERAQALLEELEQAYDKEQRKDLELTPAIYNAVITAWGRSRHGEKAAKAQQVLEQLKRRSETIKGAPKPDTITYNAVMDVISRQGTVEAAETNEAILLELLEAEDVGPNQISFATVMNAWARAGDGNEDRVMAIYKRLLTLHEKFGKDNSLLRPDSTTYGILLSVWSKSKRRDAGVCAEKLLREMREFGLTPNVVHYNNVILAHARSQHNFSYERAKLLLDELVDLYAQGHNEMKPNTVAFTNVIQTLKRSGPPLQRAEIAWNMFVQMSKAFEEGDADVQPNVITANTVLTACAYTKGDDATRKRAVQLALAVTSELDKHEIAPNSNTFRLLLEVIGRQVPDMAERTKMAKVIIHRCSKENLVDPGVVETLEKYVPSLYKQQSVHVASRNGGSNYERL